MMPWSLSVWEIEGIRLSDIRSKWLRELPVEDVSAEDLRKLINGAMSYLHDRKLFHLYPAYRFIFSKDRSRTIENRRIRICLDLGKIKVRMGGTQTYYAFFVRDIDE